MAEKTVTTTENCNDTTTIVLTDAAGQTTKTETCTDNQTTTITATETIPCGESRCPCGDLDLHRLLEQSRRCAFKSTNISAATANGVIIFNMKVLQEILIQLCKSGETTIDDIFLVASAIGELAQVVRVYNPPPFNS